MLIKANVLVQCQCGEIHSVPCLVPLSQLERFMDDAIKDDTVIQVSAEIPADMPGLQLIESVALFV